MWVAVLNHRCSHRLPAPPRVVHHRPDERQDERTYHPRHRRHRRDDIRRVGAAKNGARRALGTQYRAAGVITVPGIVGRWQI